jgi:ankyrin repeat protein
LVDAKWAAHVWYPAPNVDEEKTNYLDLMRALLDHGADPNARLGTKLWERQFHPDWVDPAGATAFWRAAQADDLAAMKLLVAAGANSSIATTHGCSPLQVAAGFGLEPQISTFVPDARLAAVRYLVEELGADVNSKDDKGYTPLHGAALTAENNVLLYLVSMGADVKARADQVFASGDGPGEAVAAGTGDSVADMANGPRPHNLVFPETVALLEKLGSPNSDNCRASTCVIKGKPDKTKEIKKQ